MIGRVGVCVWGKSSLKTKTWIVIERNMGLTQNSRLDRECFRLWTESSGPASRRILNPLREGIVDFIWAPISWIFFERGYRGFSIRADIVVFYRSWYHGFCGKSSEWPSGQQCRTLGGSTILSQSLTSVNWLWRLVVEHRRKIHAINVDEIFRSTHIYFTSQTHSRNKCHWNIWARILRSNTCQVWLNTTRQIMKTENAVFFRKKRYSEKKV